MCLGWGPAEVTYAGGPGPNWAGGEGVNELSLRVIWAPCSQPSYTAAIHCLRQLRIQYAIMTNKFDKCYHFSILTKCLSFYMIKLKPCLQIAIRLVFDTSSSESEIFCLYSRHWSEYSVNVHRMLLSGLLTLLQLAKVTISACTYETDLPGPDWKITAPIITVMIMLKPFL